MKDYVTTALRNVALLGHGSSGKTSLGEAMLFTSGAISRQGRVEDGTTVSDYDEEEIRRHISLTTALLPIEWQNYKINVLDTPGFTDFAGEVKGAVRVVEAGVVLVDSVAGVEVGTELAWAYCNERNLPRLVLIGKMDRENANFTRAFDTLHELGGNFVPLQLPIGSQASFEGVIDLIAMKARKGPKGEALEIPANLKNEAAEARIKLMEAAAEGDDELIMKYLDGQELTDDEIRHGLKIAIQKNAIVPVLCASGTGNLGISALLETIVAFVPSPADAAPEMAKTSTGAEEKIGADSNVLGAIVFKTTADPFVGKQTYFRVFGGTISSDSRVFNANKSAEERLGQLYVMRGKEQIPVSTIKAGDIGAVTKLTTTLTGDTLCDKTHIITFTPAAYPAAVTSVAIEPKTAADSAKMGPTLTRLVEEDPTLHWFNDPSTKQTVLEGLGDSHIDVAVRRAKGKFGVELATSQRKVPYRETITKTFQSMHRHKKQTGGAGQFGEVHMRVEPNKGKGYEFLWEVFGGAVSSSYQASIEKGIKSVMEGGAIAGYPVVDVKVAITDGKEHPVDSKPIAFEVAGREAFKKAMHGAGAVLLEPVVKATVVVPESNMGDVLGDLNTKRARVQGMDQSAGKSIVTAFVPLAEMQKYAADLRSLTQGRGVFSMEFDHYDEVPAHIAQGIIEQAQKDNPHLRTADSD
ncbi:MAG TPA: elongation factor G [Anaerolineae bacterium]|nr:elongation factor G [Anaerolineae bacterium]